MSWQSATLSDLFDVKSSKRVLKSQWQETGVPFYRGREITALSKTGQVKNELYITEELYEKFSNKHGVPDAGDIVITAIGTIGNSYIVQPNERFYFKDASVLWLKKTQQIESEFVNYWLKSSHFKSQLSKDNGATVDTLTITSLKNTQISLPPLDEQKRIVQILGRTFSSIDKAIENTEKNLANARELFERHLNTIFSTDKNGWCESTLGDISDISYGYTAKASYEIAGPKFLRITDIQEGSVNWESVPKCEISNSDFKKHQLLTGDIVFARTGATTGKSYLLVTPPKSVAASYLIRMRFNQDRISPEFVKYFFNSSEYWEVVNAGISGSAQGGFNASKLGNLALHFPRELSDQHHISKALSDMEKKAKELISKYTNKIDALTELKQSILQKAFTGQLTADFNKDEEVA